VRDVEDVLRFHKPVTPGPQTLAEFHEWNVAFALQKFRAKPSNDEPVSYFNFRRGSSIQIMETAHTNAAEKRAVFRMVRAACREPAAGVEMLSMISEVWIAISKDRQDILRYPSVRETPGREDGLMVSTYSRDGGVCETRWVVRLKPDPADNLILARDDVAIDEADVRSGPAADFFQPEHLIDQEGGSP
jgi:hypothetical protein